MAKDSSFSVLQTFMLSPLIFLPEVAPVNPDDYLAYIEAGGIAPAPLSVIRMLHTGYPSGSSSSSAAGR